jgi:acetyl esterase/lipase
MPSLRCRLFLFLLHHRHLLRFRLKPETQLDWETELPRVRQTAARASRLLGKTPKGIEAVPAAVPGMPAEWIRPVGGGDPDTAILYFHGGGYIMGTVEHHQGIVAKFVKASGIPALLFGYRLAPEHPYPAALHDAQAAYAWLLDQGLAASRIVFAGDSAGGGLALATLLAARDRGLPLPAAVAALSPFTDLTCSGESLKSNVATCLAPPGSWLACRTHYARGRDFTDPYISPLFGDLAGLPPLLLFAGGAETLRDDAVRFAQKAAASGVDATLRVGDGLCHCYPACAPLFPEATAAMQEIGEFLAKHAKGEGGSLRHPLGEG